MVQTSLSPIGWCFQKSQNSLNICSLAVQNGSKVFDFKTTVLSNLIILSEIIGWFVGLICLFDEIMSSNFKSVINGFVCDSGPIGIKKGGPKPSFLQTLLNDCAIAPQSF